MRPNRKFVNRFILELYPYRIKTTCSNAKILNTEPIFCINKVDNPAIIGAEQREWSIIEIAQWGKGKEGRKKGKGTIGPLPVYIFLNLAFIK